jgi:hypothetical protein
MPLKLRTFLDFSTPWLGAVLEEHEYAEQTAKLT